MQSGNNTTATPPVVALNIAIGINKIDIQNGKADVSFAMDGRGTEIMFATYALDNSLNGSDTKTSIGAKSRVNFSHCGG